MGSGPWRPGQRPARGFHPPDRPQAFVPDVAPPVATGALLRRGYNASRHPSKRFRFPRRPVAHEVYGGGGGEVLPFGAAGVGALVLELEPGTKTSYAWSTDIVRSYSGLEIRSSPFPRPKQRFEGAAFLLDADSRDARGILMRAAAAGSTFLMALPHEGMTISADSIATTVTVGSTAVLDWAQPGQRAVIEGVDKTVVYVVIQSVTATTIGVVVTSATGAFLFGPIGAAGRAGSTIMPLLQVLLDPQQGFARYPVHVDMWSVRASAIGFGWAGVDAMGSSATITTYTQGQPIALSKIVDADLLIWDRPNAIADTATEGMLSGAEALDLGALATGFGDQTVADWARPILYTSTSMTDWQWLKAFLRLLRGRQRAFLLSTNRDDLIYVGAINAGIKVQSASVAGGGGGDYASWWVSFAHRRLAFTMIDGSIQYATVINAPIDNGDGTLSLTLDNTPNGTVAKISIAEQVRLDNGDSDELAVTWDGGAFTFESTARSVQDVIIPPSLFMFDTVINLSFSYSGIFPDVPPPDQEFGPGPLGQVTLITVLMDRTLTFGGIFVLTAPVDGLVVMIKNVTLAAPGLIFNHEDTNFAAADRFWLASQTGHGGAGIGLMFVYNATIQRWVQIA